MDWVHATTVEGVRSRQALDGARSYSLLQAACREQEERHRPREEGAEGCVGGWAARDARRDNSSWLAQAFFGPCLRVSLRI